MHLVPLPIAVIASEKKDNLSTENLLPNPSFRGSTPTGLMRLSTHTHQSRIHDGYLVLLEVPFHREGVLALPLQLEIQASGDKGLGEVYANHLLVLSRKLKRRPSHSTANVQGPAENTFLQ